MLYRFGISQDSLCSFCSLEEESPIPIFFSCNHAQILWERLKYYIQKNLDLPSLTSQVPFLASLTLNQKTSLLYITYTYFLSIIFLNLEVISIFVSCN